MKYKIIYDSDPKPDDIKTIWEGISEHAKKIRELPSGKPFAFFIRDEFDQIKSGCSGYIYYGCFYVDLLWVDPLLRGKRYGTQLMKEAEKLAQENDCHFMAVNTMDFEALEFYKKLGFIVEFERQGFDKNSIMFFLRKNLNILKNKNAKSAFHWIVSILTKLNIPFQIAGGLAANIYGANRPLEDIDIDIPEEYFSLVKTEVKDHITYGPAQFKDDIWDLMLMTLNYNGQFIDLGGAFNSKIFNKNTKEWQACYVDFSKSEVKKCFDLDVPVISKDQLLFYKKIIARPVDIIDIAQIEHQLTATKEINFDDIKLIPASIEDYSTIQNMARFYVYDITEYLGNEEGWECPENGLYECIDFKKYWQADDTFPFLIKYKNELVGFVIVDKNGSESNVDFNVAQFFILRKFKSKGVGKYIAHHCFNKFFGIWEVMVMPGNNGAYRFWQSVISEYTNNKFNEYTKTVKYLDNSLKNIFSFNSNGTQDSPNTTI